MPYNPSTGVFTRVDNSFSNPVAGTVIDNEDAVELFDDYDSGFTDISTGEQPFIGTVTITPPAGTLDRGVDITQTPAGTNAAPVDYNKITITDSLNNGAFEAHGLMIEHNVGESTLQGGRAAFYSLMNFQSATSGSNPNRNYGAGTFLAYAHDSDGPLNNLTAVNTVTQLYSGATDWAQIAGIEVDISVLPGASVVNKFGVMIAQFDADSAQGSVLDAALILTNYGPSSPGWKDLIQIGGPAGSNYPGAPTGNILRTDGGGTAANGIDLSDTTITGSAFKSNGFAVDGSGGISNSSNILSTGTVRGATFQLGSILFAQTSGVFHQITSADGSAALSLGNAANQYQAASHQFIDDAGTEEFGRWETTGLRLGVAGTKLGAALFSGNTSGTVTVQPQAAAGTPTLTFPSTSGTFAVSATTPLSLSATTGDLTLATVPATLGGTGQTSYAVGDLLYASTTTALSKLADVATGNALISGGVNTAPAWGKIGLTTHISGVLDPANGGTGVANNAAATLTRSGNHALTITTAGATNVTLPTSGTLVAQSTGPITPGISFGGGTTGITYTNRTGSYIRTGEFVWFTVEILLSSKGSSTGAALLTDLPFTANGGFGGVPVFYNNVSGLTGTPGLDGQSGTTTAKLTQLTTSTAVQLDDTNFTNTSFIIFNGMYRVS